MKLGVTFPQNVIGGDPKLVRDFAQTVEGLGYTHLVAYDHVVGINPASYPDWTGPYTSADLFHDPFTLFSFIAGFTEKIELSPQIVILPQRQTVLVAKQAASLDMLSGGRLRLGVGIGWNHVEYAAMGENFRNRGKRSEEQIAVMRALWSNPHVVFEGKHHTIPDAGINPLPEEPLAIWLGGGVDATYDRIGRLGDGWLNIYHGPDKFQESVVKIHASAEKAGRDPKSIGLESWIGMSDDDSPELWRSEIEQWRNLGATHLTLNTIFGRGHIRAISARDAATHLQAMERYITAVRDIL